MGKRTELEQRLMDHISATEGLLQEAVNELFSQRSRLEHCQRERDGARAALAATQLRLAETAISDDEIHELYGKGIPRSLDELRESYERIFGKELPAVKSCDHSWETVTGKYSACSKCGCTRPGETAVVVEDQLPACERHSDAHGPTGPHANLTNWWEGIERYRPHLYRDSCWCRDEPNNKDNPWCSSPCPECGFHDAHHSADCRTGRGLARDVEASFPAAEVDETR